jgi:acid phosphatase
MATLVQRRSRGVDYAIMTGDNFYTKGVSSIEDRKWVTRFEDVYGEDRFPFTFYAVLGNHDYGKNPLAQVAYHRLKNETATGRWYMPDRYYTFSDTLTDGTTVAFFALDTQILLEEGWYKGYQERTGEPPGESEKHLAWLTEQLAASRARWKIVYMHHPLYSNGRHGDAPWLIEHVKPLFEQYGVQVVFAGHDHNLQAIKPVNGVHYFVSGAGANVHSVAWRENTAHAYAGTGFMWCRLTRDKLLVVLYNRRGEELWMQEIGWQ